MFSVLCTFFFFFTRNLHSSCMLSRLRWLCYLTHRPRVPQIMCEQNRAARNRGQSGNRARLYLTAGRCSRALCAKAAAAAAETGKVTFLGNHECGPAHPQCCLCLQRAPGRASCPEVLEAGPVLQNVTCKNHSPSQHTDERCSSY